MWFEEDIQSLSSTPEVSAAVVGTGSAAGSELVRVQMMALIKNSSMSVAESL